MTGRDQVPVDDPGVAPQHDSLTELGRRSEQHDRQLTGLGRHFGLGAAGPDSVRGNNAPSTRGDDSHRKVTISTNRLRRLAYQLQERHERTRKVTIFQLRHSP